MKKVDVFLGGTCGKNDWRDRIMPELDRLGITYFNPVVPNWTPECQLAEDFHKETAGIQVYYLGNPMDPLVPEVSAYSCFELGCAGTDMLVAIAIDEWNNTHLQKAMYKIAADLALKGVTVHTNLEELVKAIKRRLGK